MVERSGLSQRSSATSKSTLPRDPSGPYCARAVFDNFEAFRRLPPAFEALSVAEMVQARGRAPFTRERRAIIASAGGCRDAVRAGRRHMVMVHAGGTWNSGREEPDEPSGCRGRRFREQALARGRAGQQHVRPAGDPGEAPGLAIGHRDVRPAWRGCRRERVWARRPMPPRPRTTWSTPSPTVAAEQARARPSDGVQVIAGKG